MKQRLGKDGDGSEDGPGMGSLNLQRMSKTSSQKPRKVAMSNESKLAK